MNTNGLEFAILPANEDLIRIRSEKPARMRAGKAIIVIGLADVEETFR